MSVKRDSKLSQPEQDGKVGLVHAAHVAGDRGQHDVQGVARPYTKHMVDLVVVCVSGSC